MVTNEKLIKAELFNWRMGADINDILGSLYSDEARAFVVLNLPDLKNVYEGSILRAIDSYEKREDFDEAADIAKKAGLLEKEIELYEKQEYFEHAADIAEKALGTERAIDILCRAACLQNTPAGRERYLKDALERAKKAGLTAKIIEIYEKGKNFDKAADAAKEAGLVEKAMENYEKEGDYKEAAEVAEKAGLTERAEMYRTLDNLLK